MNLRHHHDTASTPWCGKDWNSVAEPETNRNVTDKKAQA